jgi:biopolymer transport protein ExbD
MQLWKELSYGSVERSKIKEEDLGKVNFLFKDPDEKFLVYDNSRSRREIKHQIKKLDVTQETRKVLLRAFDDYNYEAACKLVFGAKMAGHIWIEAHLPPDLRSKIKALRGPK